MLAAKSNGVAAAAVESRRHTCGQIQRVNLARVAVIALSVIVAAESSGIVADDRSNIIIAANFRVGERILECAAEVGTDNTADILLTADFAFNCAVFYRGVVCSRDSSDIVIAADVYIGKVDVLNLAVVIVE